MSNQKAKIVVHTTIRVSKEIIIDNDGFTKQVINNTAESILKQASSALTDKGFNTEYAAIMDIEAGATDEFRAFLLLIRKMRVAVLTNKEALTEAISALKASDFAQNNPEHELVLLLNADRDYFGVFDSMALNYVGYDAARVPGLLTDLIFGPHNRSNEFYVNEAKVSVINDKSELSVENLLNNDCEIFSLVYNSGDFPDTAETLTITVGELFEAPWYFPIEIEKDGKSFCLDTLDDVPF